MSFEPSTAVLLETAPPESQNSVPPRGWRISDAATAITALVFLAFAIVMALPIAPRDGFSSFTQEHIVLLHMVDTWKQRLADKVSLLVLAMLCVLGAAMIARPSALNSRAANLLRMTGRLFRRWSGIFCATAAAMVLAFNLPGTVFPPPTRPELLPEILLLTVCFTIVGLALFRNTDIRVPAFAIWGFVAAYGLFLTVPGLIRRPRLVEPDLSWAEWHYSVTLAQADRLAAGLRIGSQVNLNYGLLHSMGIALLERIWGLPDFGAHVRIVQIFQIAFLAVAIVAFHLWKPENPLFPLFGALLVGPWVSTSHLSVFYPNETGWRSLGLAVGVAILLMCRRWPRRAAWILGAVASFLVLYNPETGLCLTFGYGLYLLFRLKRFELAPMCWLALRAATAAAMVFLSVFLLFRAGFGSWPFVELAAVFGLTARFGQGYGGLPLYFDPLAVLIFIHATYIASSTVLKWRTRGLDSDESVKLAIAGAILAWSAYFVKRPHAWNLWTYQFLYLFLIADWLNPRVLRRLSLPRIDKTLFDRRIAALAFLLLPMVLYVNWSAFRETIFPVANSRSQTEVASGLFMPQDAAESIVTQAGFLKSQQPETLFFSSHSYSLSLLTRRFNPLPAQDVFAETVSDSEFESLVAEILRNSPPVILFDAPTPKPLGAEDRFIYYYYMHFFERLKDRLAKRYDQESTTSGWQVWNLRLPTDTPGIREKMQDPRG